eukprot:2873751-Pleurochrysis_carterae.AAC.2
MNFLFPQHARLRCVASRLKAATTATLGQRKAPGRSREGTRRRDSAWRQAAGHSARRQVKRDSARRRVVERDSERRQAARDGARRRVVRGARWHTTPGGEKCGSGRRNSLVAERIMARSAG